MNAFIPMLLAPIRLPKHSQPSPVYRLSSQLRIGEGLFGVAQMVVGLALIRRN